MHTHMQRDLLRGSLANHKTLVLDRNGLPFGYPLHRFNGYQALSALALGRVQMVKPSHYWVRSQRDWHQLPSVVQLCEDLPMLPLEHEAPMNLRTLFLRDRGRCQYTGKALRIGSPNPEVRATIEQDTIERATIDHVVPRAQGGLNQWSNVVLAGAALNNNIKGDKTPEECGLSLLALPWVPTMADLLLIWLSTEMLTDLPPEWQEFIQPEDLQRRVVENYPVQAHLILAA